MTAPPKTPKRARRGTTQPNPHARPGYKHTKLGWIPEEWEVVPLGRTTRRIMVGIASAATHAYRASGVLMLRNQNILPNRIEESDVLFLDPAYELTHRNKRLQTGDVVTMRTGYPGVSAVVPSHLEGAQCFTSLITRPDPEKLNSEFLAYYINSPLGARIIGATEIGGAQKNVNAGSMQMLPLIYPQPSEQVAIVEVLQAWDHAIATTQQQLAAKQELQRGLMQELLNGRWRFPEFTEPWREVRLGELGNTYTGLTNKSAEDFGTGQPYIPYLNVFSNSRIDVAGFERVRIAEGERQYRAQRGDIFFTVSSETPDEVGMSSVLLDDVDELYLNSFCFGFRLHGFDQLLPEFARYYLRGPAFRREVRKLAQGATRFNLSKTELLKILLYLPIIEEQRALAKCLSCHEQEIAYLTDQLDHLTTQKRGLMQVLLTGAVRVKNSNIEQAIP